MKALALGLALAASGSAALAAEPSCARHVSVTGVASSAQAPDFAEIAIGDRGEGADPAAAVDAASKAVAGVVAQAREAGLQPAEIGTAAVTLQPATRPVNGRAASRRSPTAMPRPTSSACASPTWASSARS